MSVDTRLAAEPRWTNGQLNALAALDLPKPLREAIANHTRTFLGWVAAGAQAQQANAASAAAHGHDAEARAVAISKGQPAPKPTAPAAQQAAADAAQRVADMGRAVVLVEQSIPDLVAAHQPQLLEQLDTEQAVARAAIRRTLADLQAALMVLARQTRIRPPVLEPHDQRNWLPSWPAPTLTAEVTGALAALAVFGNEPRTAAEEYAANAVPDGSYSPDGVSFAAG